jgi:hypothetical protein
MKGPIIISTANNIKKISVTPVALSKGTGYQTKKTMMMVIVATKPDNSKWVKNA